MAERIDIRITAKDQTRGALGRISQNAQQLGTSLRSVSANTRAAAQGLERVGQSAQRSQVAVRGLRTLFLELTAALATRAAVNTIVDFEQGIANLRAVLADSASVGGLVNEQFTQLESTIRELGRSTQFTATQVADAATSLARAGFSLEETTAALPTTLNLAIAGQLGIAEATNIAANSLRAFNIPATDTVRVADTLAKTTTRTNTTLSLLASGLSFVAPTAANLNLSIEETTAALGILSDAGIKGTRAGTGLNGILAALSDPSKEAAETLKRLGVSEGDVDIKSRGLAAVLTTLSKAGLTAGDTFQLFDRRTAPAAQVLIAAATASGETTKNLIELTKEVQNASGSSAQLASVVQNTLGGAILRFQSALADLVITIGKGGLGQGLRDAVEGLTSLVIGLSGTADTTETATNRFFQLGEILNVIFKSFRDIFGTLGDVASALFGATGEADLLQFALIGIGIVIAGIADGVDVLTLAFLSVADPILDVVAPAISTLITGVGNLAGIIDTELGNSIRGIAQGFLNSAAVVDGRVEVLKDNLIKNFEESNSNLDKFKKRLAEAGDGAKIADVAIENSTNKITSNLQTTADETENSANKITESLDKIAEASARASFDTFRSRAQTTLAQLKVDFENGLLPITQFFQQRLSIQDNILAQQEQLIRGQITNAETESERIRLNSQLIGVIEERKRLAISTQQEEAQALEDLNNKTRDLRVRLQQALGQPVAIADLTDQVRGQFADVISQLEAQGDVAGVAIAEKLVNVEVAKARFQELANQATLATNALSAQEGALQAQVQTGAISAIQAEQQLNAARVETRDNLAAIAEQQRIIAEQSGDPQLVIQAQNAANAITQIRTTAEQNALAINQSLENSFANAFEAIATGTKTVGEAFSDMARSILADIAKIAAQRLASQLFGGLGSGAGSTGGIGGFLGGLFGGFATGGYVSGPGTGTSDSIPAKLSNGEYVIPANVVKKFGRGFFDSIRLGGLSVPRFADGGLVGDTGAGSAQAAASGMNLRIVNVTDPSQLEQFMSSSDGARVILNQIRKNSRSVKQYIQNS